MRFLPDTMDMLADVAIINFNVGCGVGLRAGVRFCGVRLAADAFVLCFFITSLSANLASSLFRPRRYANLRTAGFFRAYGALRR